jgi:hypothetical protein
MLAREHPSAIRQKIQYCRYHRHYGNCWVASQQGGYLRTQPYCSPTEDLVCFGQNPGASEL